MVWSKNHKSEDGHQSRYAASNGKAAEKDRAFLKVVSQKKFEKALDKAYKANKKAWQNLAEK